MNLVSPKKHYSSLLLVKTQVVEGMGFFTLWDGCVPSLLKLRAVP